MPALIDTPVATRPFTHEYPMPAMSGRTRRRPTSTLPDTRGNARSPSYQPKPIVGPSPPAGARPKLTPPARPAFTSSSFGKIPPTDPPMPTRLAISITWAEALEVVIAQATIANTRTRLIIHEPHQGPGTKDQGPRTRDQGPGTKDQGRTRNQGRTKN